jgi:hypothetical protein
MISREMERIARELMLFELDSEHVVARGNDCVKVLKLQNGKSCHS